jgi:hypothetical protein
MSIIDAIYAKLKTARPETAREVLDFLEFVETRAKPVAAQPRNSWEAILDALPGKSGFHGDPVDIQRRLRSEWDPL